MEKNTANQELMSLRSAAIERDRANVQVERAVQKARRAGASWAAIAMPLGITRQAAQQKYSVSSPELIAADSGEDRAAIAAYEAPKTVAGQSAIFLDGTAPATATGPTPLPEYTNPMHWAKDDWKQDDPIHFLTPLKDRHFGPCRSCGQKSHKQFKGGTWIYPGCLPTLNDPVYIIGDTK